MWRDVKGRCGLFIKILALSFLLYTGPYLAGQPKTLKPACSHLWTVAVPSSSTAAQADSSSAEDLSR